MSEQVPDTLQGMLASILIAQARCYDVLLLILAESNEQTAKRIRQAHEEGELFMPAPSFVVDDEDTSDTNDLQR